MFLLIKSKQTKIFVDKIFSYKIFFQCISQYRHCQKQQESKGPDSKMCNILKKPDSKQRTSGKSKNKFTQEAFNGEILNVNNIQGCEIHGSIDLMENIIDLGNKKLFISYTCFLAQLMFKIMNIEEKDELQKEHIRKFICNILFIMMDHCDSKFYYYPMKALSEFFLEKEAEKSLSKRLNAESFLSYKNYKEILGRSDQLKEYNTQSSLKRGNIMVASGFRYLYTDTIKAIRAVISKLDSGSHLECYIICLKILSKILEYPYNKNYKNSVVTLYVECLVAISQKLGMLKLSEKEIYYSEVKSLIKLIQQERETHPIQDNESDKMLIDSQAEEEDRIARYKKPE